MAYTVFFAFQMDIDDKYGKGFIQSAIEIAIQKLKSEGIDVKLDFGFRGTPGTPLLIDEMLKKSSNADMVIADLTFTSSKVWYDAELIDEDDSSSWFSIPKGNKKLSPNPNVLLETGYAWAKKGTYRTLAVMNTAFGIPDELPVDLKGFRWGITYALNANNYTKKKEIRKILASDFYDAIKTAINSEAHYQQEKWKPIRLYRNWKPRDFNTIYNPTNSAKEIIKQLRIDLENTESAQRIVGPKNSGKTRLIFELYRKIDETIVEHENLKKVLYYDLDGGDFRSIESKILDLKELNQRKILILDNCPIKIHKKVFDEYLYNTKVSLLSIGNTEDGDGANHFLDKEFANEIIEKLSNEKGNAKDTSFILRTADGNLRSAIMMMGKIPEGEPGLSADYQSRWKQILGVDLFDQKILNVLEELSLFTHIGISDRFETQSEILLHNTQVGSKEELNEIIDQLSETGIVKITGDFIILEAFIEDLAFNRLKKLTNEDLKEYFSLLTKLKLSKQFSNRLVQLNRLTGTKELINALSKENGVIYQEAFVDSDQGARILMSLAEIEPEIVLSILNNTLLEKTYQELKAVEKGRRYIVWTLERLVYREETFEGAATLLFKLAVAENEFISNNATAQFCQLFQVKLPATTVSLEKRLGLIKSLLENSNSKEKAVITKVLDRALMTRGFVRMGGAEEQAGEKFEDYNPKSIKEILDYWKTAIELLEQLEEYETLINKFSVQVYGGNSTAMIEVIERMLAKGSGIEKDLRQQFENILTDKRELPNATIERIQSILEKYSNNSLREQLEYKVSLAPYSNYRDEKGNLINKSEENLIDFVSELNISGNLEWLKELDVLLQNEQRLTYIFGRELAIRNINNELFIEAVIEKLSRIPFEQQNNSLLIGYCSEIKDNKIIRNIIDRLLLEEKIEFHAIQTTRTLDVQYSDLEKLMDVIFRHPNYVVSLQYLNLNKLSLEEFQKFIEWVKSIEPYGWWVAIELSKNFIDKNDHLTDSIQSLIRSLLIKENILKGENIHTPIAMHYYVELLKKQSDLDQELVTFLTKEITNATKEISFNNEYYLKDILELLIKKEWGFTWDSIGPLILEQDFYGWYNLKDILNKVKVIKDENLLKWMDNYPNEAPQTVIDFIDLVSKTGDEEYWSELTKEMFNRYCGNEQFLNALESRLGSFSWSGSLVPLLISKKKLLEQLLDHDKQQVKEFAERNIRYFESQIEREKRSDKNYGLEF